MKRMNTVLQFDFVLGYYANQKTAVTRLQLCQIKSNNGLLQQKMNYNFEIARNEFSYRVSGAKRSRKPV